MSDTKRCPICGSIDTTEIDKESQKYICNACMKEFLPRIKEKKIAIVEGDCSTKNAFDNMLKKVVELHAYFDNDVLAGTGFFISNDYMLTNAHIISKIGEETPNMFNMAIQVTGNDYSKQKNYIFEIVSADKKLDIAILKLQEGKGEYAQFSNNIFNGEKVYAIGNSRGEGLCIVDGIVSDAKREVNSNEYFMTSVLVTNGNSGCPVFNTNGQILGMITEGSKGSVAMNYAIPSAVLIEYIKSVEISEEIKIL